MPKLQHSPYAGQALNRSVELAKRYRHEFITPEHLLAAINEQDPFQMSMTLGGAMLFPLDKRLVEELEKMERVPDNVSYELGPSIQLDHALRVAYDQVQSSSATMLDVPHLVKGILELKDSKACQLLLEGIACTESEFLADLVSCYEEALYSEDNEEKDDYDSSDEKENKSWQQLVICLNDHVADHNPLIGRENELERTIQVLCRRDKNNPLHVGEPGVGKTALVYGLVERIVKGDVPERLKDSRVYLLDLGSLLAGTQFRGDFEKRLKMVMEGISKEKAPIVYIDEIHNLVGAGRTNDGSMDASNMLKPYLETGKIRFIGSTTYEEYNRYFSRSKGMVRRFQQIDIPEPSIDEAVNIVERLQPVYAEFHHVSYADDVARYVVEASHKHINERFLPDKAIDLIDEAGAWREIHPQKKNEVDRALINQVLSKICKVDAMAMEADDNARLETLYERMNSQIYGQDNALRQVVEAIQLSKAGLTDEDKPLAALLFVGPTGVGKTEVARVLARELGIALVRFDMSEYTEKHAVAKLIGSPAGYVGYEDGGLLTDAIRKSPNCVLLLDEIEKAHQDIYNILLQVMDYARLTDNKGRQADFRNVVLLMTSNAGAQYAAQASVGFSGHVSAGEAMLRQVKKTFKPEFLNRLSGTVVFNDMDRHMAGLILDKKLRELDSKLATRGVSMTLTPEAREWLLNEGYTREYGAREFDRVIAQKLKPMLMREILFGKRKKIKVTVKEGELIPTPTLPKGGSKKAQE
ncbi:MAG: AAA family ATPase [Prevotella sp.]|nr:AAA family ATPase [Prevotella sp.]